MEHMTFGRRCGLRVSAYALGTVNFGTSWGGGTERAEARKIFDRFAEAGGTFIDTADCYNDGEAETLLGEFLGARRDQFALASKYSYGSGPGAGVQTSGNSRTNMIRSVEASLRRLNTGHIDLYWVHFPDLITPVDEIVAALDDLVRAGKIRYAGLSNFAAWQVSRAATLTELRGWSPMAGIQTEYSLIERTADRELLPMADALGLGVAQWGPLGGGLLTGKYRRSSAGRLTDWGGRIMRTESDSRRTAIVDEVLAVADETGAAPAQVAVAWLNSRARRAGTAHIPVIGPRTAAQLDGYLTALDLTLSDEHLERLDAVSAVPLGSPHEIVHASRGALLGGDPARFRSAVPQVP
ncbi:aldo/keto reductase [Streptomyces tubercidicus]|uniref:Oxidoreductase n=2 Tax=Streptomyces tubercidicus TaxID=47759 RepID=A0A640UVP1_9ACTN|nr:aldo/keto reductase [Streptomyces tubercidicus]WAU14460.1 aldo/keto reductase [Streptomyces tubercidicus]GFE40198.1 oxidoreductase [Streptomyces tubercidicus]